MSIYRTVRFGYIQNLRKKMLVYMLRSHILIHKKWFNISKLKRPPFNNCQQ